MHLESWFQSVLDFVVRYSGVVALAISLTTFIHWLYQHCPRFLFTDQKFDIDFDKRFAEIQMICSNKGNLPLSIVSVEYLHRSVWIPCSVMKNSEIPIMLGPYESKKCIFVFPFPDSNPTCQFSFEPQGDMPADTDVNLKIVTSRGKTKCRFHVDQLLRIESLRND